MNTELLSLLQSKFECVKCGHCCAQGGDMTIHLKDINRIIEAMKWEKDTEKLSLFCPVPETHDDFVLKNTHPCHFWDAATKECSINESKPDACLKFPFLLYDEYGCDFSALAYCPAVLVAFKECLE
jgi:Fe-S-cluster containining protein